MFDTAAAQVLAAVEKSEAGQRSDGSATDEWASIRRHCKEVMVCLESHGQHILAARVEREYERLKQTCRASDSRRARYEFVDAAEELHTTLIALNRFQKHIARDVVFNRESSNGTQEPAPARATPRSDSRIDRGVVTDQRLRELFRANLARYRREGKRILAGDTVSKRQFSAEFGSMNLARKWAAEDGRADDRTEINRWGTAIRNAPFYKVVFQPFTGREVRVPSIWQSIMRDDARWDDIIHEAAIMAEDAP